MESASAIFVPAYRKLFDSGELAQRATHAAALLHPCALCAQRCGINRQQGEVGVCQTGAKVRICSYGPHHGEEQPLVGFRGSGTIFFSWCNLGCIFCQNWEISQQGEGHEVSAKQLAETMLSLQQQGCHNINLVSPSHVIAQFLQALLLAAEAGLMLPLVYNSGGYDSLDALELLDGVIDIYMPDMKFADSALAAPFLQVKDYAEVNFAAVKEMHRQVGDLLLSEAGIAKRGLLVRHLVLPENLAGTDRILKFLAEEISPDTYLNLMDQYRPCYRANDYPPLDRRPSWGELKAAQATAKRLGLKRLDRR